MRIRTLQVTNFRSLTDSGELECGAINLCVGKNNAGKSALLAAISSVQEGSSLSSRDIRIGEPEAVVRMAVSEVAATNTLLGGASLAETPARLSVSIIRSDSVTMNWAAEDGSGHGGVQLFSATEPSAPIIPVFNRRPAMYTEQISLAESTRVRSDATNLPARLDRLMDLTNPASEALRHAMDECLGVNISAVASGSGKLPGLYLSPSESVYLDRMGAGVANGSVILSSLVGAAGKVFLIEEPETDLHPSALRAILEVVIQSSATNQFFISTHSHVVVTYLGGQEETTIWSCNLVGSDHIPHTEVRVIENSPEGRAKVLEALGYELRDLEFFDGWLILEESSAGRLIRDFLIPWFVPRLRGRLRTVEGRGISTVEPTFEDFRRLFLFLHLERLYSRRAWVWVDGDEPGHEVADRLRATYSSWGDEHFSALREPEFEGYLPSEFEAERTALNSLGGDDRRKAKKELWQRVFRWSTENETEARVAFEVSAAEVVEGLREIASSLERPAEHTDTQTH